MLEINGRGLIEQKKDVSSQPLAANLWGRIGRDADFPGRLPHRRRMIVQGKELAMHIVG
jgi:hypothetical protein